MLPAIDEVLTAYGWSPLSITTAGNIETGHEPAYSGTPDFTLDASTATGGDIIRDITATVDDANIANLASVLDGQGVAWDAYDPDSWTNPGADNFIGDLWHAALVDRDTPTPGLRAQILLASRMKRRQVVEWTREVWADIEPGHFVKVKVPNIGVPDDTVMRVLIEQGNVDFDAQDGQSTYTCEIEA